MTSSASTYLYLTPALIVALTGVVILVLDLVLGPARPGAHPARPWLAYVGVAGLALAAVAVVVLAGVRTTLFGGLILLDPLATYFQVLFLAIGIGVLLLSVDGMSAMSKWPAEFYTLVVWCTLGHVLLSSAGELFTIFIALQLTSMPLIVLIGYAKGNPRSGEASLKYLVLVLVSTALLLYGMSLIYGSLGTSTLASIGQALARPGQPQQVLVLGLVLLLTGFAFKITAAPFHYWAPDAYEGAPAPVTAFLSVGSKFAGFALALRIIITVAEVPLAWGIVFGSMAVLSMLVGNLGAIPQTNIKRMLAYSGIAQAGFLLIGVAAMSKESIGAVLFYAAAYTAANLTAFSVVILISNACGTEQISDYAGMGKRSPLAALALSIALLSLAGLPLMAGFMAKFYLFLSAAHQGLAWLVAFGVANSVISLYYYLRVLWWMYVKEGPEERVAITPRVGIVLSVAVTGVVALGLFPEPALRAAVFAASTLFGR